MMSVQPTFGELAGQDPLRQAAGHSPGPRRRVAEALRRQVLLAEWSGPPRTGGHPSQDAVGPRRAPGFLCGDRADRTVGDDLDRPVRQRQGLHRRAAPRDLATPRLDGERVDGDVSARSIISASTSTPVTEPVGPTASAANSASMPVPHPGRPPTRATATGPHDRVVNSERPLPGRRQAVTRAANRWHTAPSAESSAR